MRRCKLPEEEQQWSEDRDWKYSSTSIKKIRSHFMRYRPDLVHYQNPIAYEKNDPKNSRDGKPTLRTNSETRVGE